MSGESEEKAINQFILWILWQKFRTELLARPLFYLGVSTTIIFLAALFYWPIRVTRYGKLTDLDQILFQLFLVALPAVISWVFAKRKEEQNVLAKQKALAKSAVRRISSISAAANRLSDRIEARKSAIMSGTEWVPNDPTQKALFFELFDGLSRQVAEMRDNIAASEGDWRDILPEEFAKKEQVEREILQQREIAIEAREKAFAEAQQTLKKGEGKTAEQLAALKALLAKQLENVEERLSLKVEQLRSQMRGNTIFGIPASGSLVNWSPLAVGSLENYNQAANPSIMSFANPTQRSEPYFTGLPKLETLKAGPKAESKAADKAAEKGGDKQQDDGAPASKDK